MSKSCYFCAKDGNHHGGGARKGGSLASDAVVSLVSCDTFEQMSTVASNAFTGGAAAARKTRKPATASKKSKQQQRGGMSSACDDAAATSMLDAYVIGPASVPSTIPAVNDGGINLQNVQASVLASLAQQPPSVTDTYSSIVYPNSVLENNIMMRSQFGGSAGGAGCMCD